MIRSLPRVAVQVWIVLFLVFFGAEVIHLEPGLRILTQVLYGIPLAIAAVVMLRGPFDRLDAAVLMAIAIYAVVALLSRDVTESIGTLALVVGYASWFLLVRRLRPAERGHLVLAVAVGLALTLAINAWFLVDEKLTLIARFGGAPLEGVNTFPWESVNALPILVLVTIPFLAWLPPGPGRAALSAVVGASAAVVVPISLGRAGWLALGTVAFLLLVAWAWRHFDHSRLLVAGGAAAVVLTGALVVLPRLAAGLADSARLLLWEQGLNLVARSPLVGHGPGVYSWVRLEAPPETADLVAVRLLHNVPLQTLVDGGLALLVALIFPMAAWVVVVRHSRSRGRANGVAIAVLVGYATSLLLDDFSYLPAVVGTVLTVAALVAPVPALRADGGATRLALPGALAVAALVALPGVLGVDAARLSAQSGRTAMVDGRYDQAVEDFVAATGAHSGGGGYWLGLGMAHAWAGDLAAAASAYRRAIEVAPGDARGYAALAALDPSRATELLASAAERTTGDPRYAVLLGSQLADAGDLEGVRRAWTQAVALWPAYVNELPYDGVEVTEAEVVDGARLSIDGGLRPGTLESRVALWDLGLATDALPADAGPAWHAVEAGRDGHLSEAAALADRAVADAPWAARGYQARAAIAALACRPTDEADALELQAIARGAHGLPATEPALRREFIYREASLGPTQPPDALPPLPDEIWPWSLIERPTCP